MSRSSSVALASPDLESVRRSSRGVFPRDGGQEGDYRITRLPVFIDDLVRPRAFLYTTDDKAPPAEIDLGLAFEKPALSFVLPRTINVRARVDCQFFVSEIAT